MSSEIGEQWIRLRLIWVQTIKKKKKKRIPQYFRHDAYFSLAAKITLEDLI